MRTGDIVEVTIRKRQVRGRVLYTSYVAADGFGYLDIQEKGGEWHYLGISPTADAKVRVVERIGTGRHLAIKEQ